MNNTHTQQNKAHFEILLATVENLQKALDEYKDYFVISKDESIKSILIELHNKINANPEEFKKATSNTTDEVLNIIDKRWEQIKRNAIQLQKFYNQNIENKNTRPMLKHFLKAHQKFSSIYQHAIFAQNALKDTKQIVDANFTYKANITNISKSENKSQLHAIAQPNESQSSLKLSPISNTKKITTSNIKR